MDERTRQNVERNKREGLLCACNKTLVPFYRDDGLPGHGTRLIDGIMHRYDDCGPVELMGPNPDQNPRS